MTMLILALWSTQEQVQRFVSIMLGIALATPPVYAVTLAVHKIVPKTWIAYAKRHVLHMVYRITQNFRG